MGKTPISQAQVKDKIRKMMRNGDIQRIADASGFSTWYVGQVLRDKRNNEKIVRMALKYYEMLDELNELGLEEDSTQPVTAI